MSIDEKALQLAFDAANTVDKLPNGQGYVSMTMKKFRSIIEAYESAKVPFAEQPHVCRNAFEKWSAGRHIKNGSSVASLESYLDFAWEAWQAASKLDPASLKQCARRLIASLEYARTQEWRDAELAKHWPYYSDAVKSVLDEAKVLYVD